LDGYFSRIETGLTWQVLSLSRRTSFYGIFFVNKNMQCPACNFTNPPEVNFCGNCGFGLLNRCPSCGSQNPAGFKFCGQCGKLLNSPQPSPISPALAVSKTESISERRQLTVMFCDLVGSTTLSERMDPEDLQNILQIYYELCQASVSHYGGYIAKYLGDGLLVYFGYPRAQEDDAMQAIRASLDIINRITQVDINSFSDKPGLLKVRIGLHTGLVVISNLGAGKHTEKADVVGETPNVAARLQSLAEPGSVLISSSTYQLAKGFFDTEPLGPQSLKGISVPMAIYRVVGEIKTRSRFEVAQSYGLTSLVGREREIKLLLQSWKRVQKRCGQVLLMGGEAGVGKTRLLQMLKEDIVKDSGSWVESRCSATHLNSAFYPVIEMLEQLFRLDQHDSTELKVQKLENLISPYGLQLEETIPFLMTILAIPPVDRYPAPVYTPEKAKQQTLQVLHELFKSMASYKPLVFILEDLHWADPSTLEFVGHFIGTLSKVPLLLVLTHRPEFVSPWNQASPITRITVSRLSRKQVEELVLNIAKGKRVPDEIREQIISKADGIPLFVEELSKMVLESGLLTEADGVYDLVTPISPIAIPSTLQSWLMARLDKLSSLKEVIQLSAVIGREFTYSLLQAVSTIEEKLLRHYLEQLVDAELLYQQGQPPDSKYTFKHALIQDAAYSSLLNSKRQQYHRHIATVLQEKFTKVKELHPELLAYHCTAGGLIKEAVGYWEKAGQRSKLGSHYLEAIAQFNNALDSLRKLPPSKERDRNELKIIVDLIAPLTGPKSFGSPEVENAINRAKELCEQTGDSTQLFPVVFGLQGYYTMKGNIQLAAEAAKRFYLLTKDTKDSALKLVSHFGMGISFTYLGQLEKARYQFQEGIKIYEPERHTRLASIYSFNPGLACMRSLSVTLWLLGFPEQAIHLADKAIEHGREIKHVYSLATALTFAAMVSYYCNNPPATRKYTEEARTICSEYGFSSWLLWSNILHGWSLFEIDSKEAGLSEIKNGILAWKSKEWELILPFFLSILAKGYVINGQYEEAEKALDEGLAVINKNGELTSESELLRLKGEVVLLNPNTPRGANDKDAESYFQHAMEVARGQKAKSFELRAAFSLGRLWHKQNRVNEARKILLDTYEWFEEGLDTSDLREAKALLSQLGCTGR
jgi:class 3 adenylate cyclase/predicted ATPase